MEQANILRPGMLIRFDGEPVRVVEAEHIKPGKGPAYVQAKMKNINTGQKVSHRFRTSEGVERIFIEKRTMQYLYSSDDQHVFMDNETYEQLTLTTELIGEDSVYFLIPNIEVGVEYMDNKPVGIELPNSVVLEIVETEPHMKGATASASYKPARLNTGLTIQIPPFLETGQKIEVDTREHKYLSKVD
jgi:elongation factor P